MYMLGLLKKQTAVHIGDLARECEVSERTIYRDINSLIKLGYVIQYRDGYKLNPSTDLPPATIEGLDIALVNYCLRTNPLMANPFFKRRLLSIEHKLAALANDHEAETIAFSLSNGTTPELSNADVLAEFIRALENRRKVRVQRPGESTSDLLLAPLAVELRDSGYFLKMTDDAGDVREFSLADLEWLAATDIPYSSASLKRFHTRAEKQVDVI